MTIDEILTQTMFKKVVTVTYTLNVMRFGVFARIIKYLHGTITTCDTMMYFICGSKENMYRCKLKR